MRVRGGEEHFVSPPVSRLCGTFLDVVEDFTGESQGVNDGYGGVAFPVLKRHGTDGQWVVRGLGWLREEGTPEHQWPLLGRDVNLGRADLQLGLNKAR